MICISVTPESRKLAKVDLLNASRYADLIELCLDRLHKDPDVGELLQGIDKPVIVSCRRPEDGGQFPGTEEERIALLRLAIVEGPAYIELDLETARHIPRFGATKRVISISSLARPLDNVKELFDQAWQSKADVVKFVWPTRTLEEAWPLLKAVAEKREIPVVGQGIGACGITFALLGRKYGSPWLYAALEKGMEAFPGQTTAFDLDEIYDLHAISAKTRFLGPVCFWPTRPLIARILNRGFSGMESSLRCLPMQVRSLEGIRKKFDLLKIPGLIVNPAIPLNLADLAERKEESVEQSRAADLLFQKDQNWHGFNLMGRVMLKSLERSLDTRNQTLKGRSVLVFGGNPLARSLIVGLLRRGCVVSVTSPDDTSAQEVAESMTVRHVPFKTVYDMRCDIAAIADAAISPGPGKQELNPAFFRDRMTIADFSQLPLETRFLTEAIHRKCNTVDPRELGFEYFSALFKAISGSELSRETFDDAVPA
jgi:3-dehydroquinate dehydratase / shikimate dehydrogenase